MLPRKTLGTTGLCLSALILAALIVGMPAAGHAADDMVNPQDLPRLDGARRDPSREMSGSLNYAAPGSVPATVINLGKLLATDGWTAYAQPLEQSTTSLYFKKGPQGLLVTLTMAGGKSDQSSVTYYAHRIVADVPFPPTATDIVFDENRPYLGCASTGTVASNFAFFATELAALGWAPLSATDIKARWPNADIDTPAATGARAYYGRDRQLPVVLTLQPRTDAKVSVEIKVAPFALPQDLEIGDDSWGLPSPKRIKSAGRTDGAARRELKATVIAEVPAALAFYRRELAARSWKEETKGAVVTPDEVKLTFSSAEGTAVLQLGHAYDLTTVNLVIQVPESVLAARAKAKRDADQAETAKFLKEAGDFARAAAAASDAQSAAMNPASKDTGAPLRALADNTAPIPLPDSATDIEFDGSDGRLEFATTSSVKAVAAFYRAALKPLGWKEQPSVINRPNMAVLEFAKGKQDVSLTVMQLGPKVNVTGSGSGLKAAAAAGQVASGKTGKATAMAVVDLEAEEGAALPVPKQHTLSAPGTWTKQGGGRPFRSELTASIPADIDAVLGFYRRELSKRNWKEAAQGAVIKPDQVKLAFAAPEGPAVLKLGRAQGETTVELVVKNAAEAAKAGSAPAPGRVKLMFGNISDTQATITIATKTIAIAPGVGSPQTPNGPTLDLPPGKYKYSLKRAGLPVRTAELDAGADETWGLMVGPAASGVLELQIY